MPAMPQYSGSIIQNQLRLNLHNIWEYVGTSYDRWNENKNHKLLTDGIANSIILIDNYLQYDYNSRFINLKNIYERKKHKLLQMTGTFGIITMFSVQNIYNNIKKINRN